MMDTTTATGTAVAVLEMATVTTSSKTDTFKTSLQLQTPKASTASVTAGLQQHRRENNESSLLYTESDPNEARYWMQKFALGSHQHNAPLKAFAHPRKLLLTPTKGTAIVQQVLFGPPPPSSTTSSSKKPSPITPLAVVGGPRVHLYGTQAVSAFHRHLSRHALTTTTVLTSTPDASATTVVVAADRQVQTGGHLALSAQFRNDGRLIAVGTDVGQVRVCDVTMRATLCTFATTKTQLPVRVVQWFRNGQWLLSGGDDAVVRIWSLSQASSGGISSSRAAAGGALLELPGHGDAVRCAVLWQPTAQQQQQHGVDWNLVAITGSYDHTVRIWNVSNPEHNADEDRCLAVLSHGAPVEALLLMPSTHPKVPVWLLSAGGVTIKVWNPVSGKLWSTITTHHRKTMTCLVPFTRYYRNVDGDSGGATTKQQQQQSPSMRIVTASLDGYIRIHQWSSQTGQLQHLHGVLVGAGEPITALAVSDGSDRIAIGTTAGTVLVRQRGPSIVQHKRSGLPKAGTFAWFGRGMNVTVADATAGNDYVLGATPKKRKLRKYDLCLKQFRYGDALDEALATRIPQVVVAVLEELGKRRGLTIALSSRDEESLEPLLAFLVRYVTRPRFTSVLIGVAHMIIDIYGDVAGQSEVIDELFMKLKTQVGNECRAQKSLLRLMGQLDAIMSTDGGAVDERGD